MKKTATILSALFLMIMFVSCSSDDNTTTIERDFTDPEYIKEIMIGTWDKIEYLNSSGYWSEVSAEDIDTYIFHHDNTFSIHNYNPDGSINNNVEGVYEIEPATEIYNATIRVNYKNINNEDVTLKLILAEYDAGVVEFYFFVENHEFRYRYKKR